LYYHRFIQPCQNTGYFVTLCSGHVSAVIVLEESCQPLVPESLDHRFIVNESGDVGNHDLTTNAFVRERSRHSKSELQE
jgi:hypothetical protein